MMYNLRSRYEESEAATTHGIGLLLSIIGGYILLHMTYTYENPLLTSLCGVYVITLTMVYLASTLSHLYLFKHINPFLRRCDQAFIYLLIVGTATPFMYFLLRDQSISFTVKLSIVIFLWLLALIGCISKLLFSHNLNNVDVKLYLILGWIESLTILLIQSSLTPNIINLMIIGGILYSIGTVFLVLDWRKYHFHTIWHILVMAASIAHFHAIVLLAMHANSIPLDS